MGNFLNFCLWKFSLKYNISQRISNYISERRNYEAGLVPSCGNLTNEQNVSVWQEGVDATNIHKELKCIFLIVHEVEQVEPKLGKRLCFEAAEKVCNGMTQ